MWEDDDSLWDSYNEIDDMEQYELDCLREDARIDRLEEAARADRISSGNEVDDWDDL